MSFLSWTTKRRVNGKLEIFGPRKTKQKERTPAMEIEQEEKKSVPESLASHHFPAFN